MPEPRFLTLDSAGCLDGQLLAYDATLHKIVPVTTTNTGGGGIFTGTTAPSNSIGADGAAYIRTNTGDLYQKEGSSWTLKGNLKGPRGDAGISGNSIEGPKGAPGDTGPPGPLPAIHFNVEPPEQKNGSNLTFTLPTKFIAGTTQVYLNGVRQRLGSSAQYVEDGTSHTISFAEPPQSGFDLWVDYLEDTTP